MNKQRKVLITTTYNEMGIIIDTKAEEVAIKGLPSAQIYEELEPEEAAKEISPGSIKTAMFWYETLCEMKRMGFVICRKNDRNAEEE